jgi:uncharacterized protein YjbJ (UPF0337 family)
MATIAAVRRSFPIAVPSCAGRETTTRLINVCSIDSGTATEIERYQLIIKKEKIMDREHVKGAAEKAKGAIKDTAGKITGDKELQTEGKLDKAKGEAHNIAGDVKDAVRKAGK